MNNGFGNVEVTDELVKKDVEKGWEQKLVGAGLRNERDKRNRDGKYRQERWRTFSC